MELNSEFTVDAPIERAWAVLNDVERVAKCLPGAELQEVDGDEYKGVVKVKVGPITAQYKGTAKFVERDAELHQIVLRAEGRETRGQGNASATITLRLTEAGDKTAASIDTDLQITGKVAQFGRGVLADVSAKLLGQFAKSLEEDLRSEDAASTGADSPTVNGANGSGDAATPGATAPSTRPDPQPADAPVNLLSIVGGSLAKRALAPVSGALAVIVAFIFFKKRRQSHTSK
jgi:uncharacterized protein